MFKYKTRIFLHHTDAAGRLFFANQFYLIHEANELFLEHLGLPIKDILNHPRATFPLVHAESDYKAVLVAGERISIKVSIGKIGETSVTFDFIILKEDGTLAGTAKTVHVAVDLRTALKTPIPAEWKSKFASAIITNA
ncbi:MAG: acyl-CoA thioesterase [Candidatus Omnitrophica bacterium]|nr:acyl-CoA thioesterase [Candidatus Omnitrophota bacterium]